MLPHSVRNAARRPPLKLPVVAAVLSLFALVVIAGLLLSASNAHGQEGGPQGVPCAGMDDPYEPNDAVGLAWNVKLPFSEQDLLSCPASSDFFSFKVAQGQTISADTFFTHATGDIDLYLYDPSDAQVATSNTALDEESIVHPAEASGLYKVEVRMFDDPDGSGNNYDLDIDVSCPPAAVSGDAFLDALVEPLPLVDSPFPGAVNCIQIAAPGVVSGLEVGLDVAHTWVGDLVVTIEHVDTGTTVTLLDRPGFPDSPFGCSGQDVDVVFSDAAATAAEDACGGLPAIAGPQRPNQLLSAFDGEAIAGAWRIQVADVQAGDTGLLNAWSLEVSGSLKEVGDVNDDGAVNAVDAALILQFNAALLADLPNAASADVNESGSIDAVDAALVLQFVAGLIPGLPV